MTTIQYTILGIGAVLRHVSTVDCDGTKHYQDLAPIEKNLNYDFNFQQTNHLPNEITIQPVSIFLIVITNLTNNRVTL